MNVKQFKEWLDQFDDGTKVMVLNAEKEDCWRQYDLDYAHFDTQYSSYSKAPEILFLGEISLKKLT